MTQPFNTYCEMKQDDSKLMLKSVGKTFSFKLTLLYTCKIGNTPPLCRRLSLKLTHNLALLYQSNLLWLLSPPPCTHLTFPPPWFAHFLLLPSIFPIDLSLLRYQSIQFPEVHTTNSTYPTKQVSALLRYLIGSNGWEEDTREKPVQGNSD